MLDINYIRQFPDQLKENIRKRHLEGKQFDVDQFLEVDKKKSRLIREAEDLRAEKNKLSDVTDKPDPKTIEQGKRLKEKIKPLRSELVAVNKKWQWYMNWFPNVTHPSMPKGLDENDNQEIKKWGEQKKFDYKAKSHLELGESLDLIDVKKSAQIAGSRFYFLKNEVVLLQWGLFDLAIKKMLTRGFRFMIPPVILKYQPLYGTGYFPSEEDQVYELKQDESIEDQERRFLAGTSEQALIAYHADEILEEAVLPIRYGGISTCFRSEAGSWGKDVRGIKRVHQFDKVEMVYFTTPETSQEFMQEALEIEEEILQELGLTYHVIEMCTGDVGFATYRKFDIEVWLPSQQAWMETHSNSDLGAYHTRRLNIRYHQKDGSLEYPHTVSATAITNTRPIAAILDTYQQEDGSVVVPEVLREYIGKEVIAGN